MRASAWGLLALLFGCDGAFGPKPHCYPVSCDQLERNCGLVDDGCGQKLDCGGCPVGSVCGLTIKNVCGTPPPVSCTPSKTCASVGAQCGSIDDGCGQQVACPQLCPPTQCGINRPNQCSVCMPPTCAPPGIGCGTITNGCNQTVECGTCAAPMMCGLQVPNICSCPMGVDCNPGPPTLFLAGVAWNRIDLAWADNGASVQGFDIQRSIDGGPFAQLESVGPSHHAYDAMQAAAGTLVGYQVRALPNGAWSNTVQTTVPAHASVWRTVGGDFSHSGFNSGETARPPATLVWEHLFDGGTPQPVVSEPPYVYAVVNGPNGSSLHAYHYDGGVEAWGQPVVGSAGQPALFDGRLLFGTSIAPMPSECFAYDTNGMLLWTAQLPGAGGMLQAPISTGEAIALIGPAGVLVQLDAQSGHTVFATLLSGGGGGISTPSLSDGLLHAFNGSVFWTVDVATGEVNGQTPTAVGASSSTWEAFAGEVGVFVDTPELVVDYSGQVLVAPSPDEYVGAVALDGTSVYAETTRTLEKLDQGGLTPNWSFPTDGGMAFAPVVAGGVVYASSDTTVFAVDATSGQLLWSTTPGGWLSIAGGMLFVASSDRLRAYALTP